MLEFGSILDVKSQNKVRVVPYQFFIFLLDLLPGGNAVPGVHERLTLGLLSNVIDEDSGYIHRDKKNDIGYQL